MTELGSQRKPYKEELHKFYSSTHNIKEDRRG
jgi:hypothetical protein